MPTETLSNASVKIRLENGRDEAGVMHYKENTLQYVDKNGYTADRALAVGNAIAPCLSKNFAGMEAIKTFVISE